MVAEADFAAALWRILNPGLLGPFASLFERVLDDTGTGGLKGVGRRFTIAVDLLPWLRFGVDATRRRLALRQFSFDLLWACCMG